jgi:hypothetical protein
LDINKNIMTKFKLGSSRGPFFERGNVKSKHGFKQDSGSIPGTPVYHVNLEGGVLGEANNDGSIFISDKVAPGSKQEAEILAHEMVHMTDMKLGKLAYNDDFVKWNGNIYPRKDGMIEYNGQMLPEGDKSFPWEKMPWETNQDMK